MDLRCLNSATGDNWQAAQGDCVDVLTQLPTESIGFSVYSPPFGSLFVYSESAADMGNSTDDEFAEHYGYLVREKFRVTKPGRLTAVHCSDLPMTKWRDGAVGIKDFSGDIIRIHEDAGWILHGRRTIWKCPVVEMTRTKHVGLLYKQLQKDSSKSRGGMPDYLLTFIKPGENAEPISHTPEEFPLSQWQEWASPVWMTVDQSNVLNVRLAREQNDERHLCPLQLDVIERAVIMWSNRGDTVLSPFMGIGSEGVVSLKLGRRFFGIELKAAYWKQACRYLESQEAQADLFAPAEDEYDADKDLARSITEGFRHIRDRKANGGPGWIRRNINSGESNAGVQFGARNDGSLQEDETTAERESTKAERTGMG